MAINLTKTAYSHYLRILLNLFLDKNGIGLRIL
ncbi:hypothetical protein SAMN06265367_102304 [Algoriphagus winogradskyi]|uniref:Uncharacterized protein n=1 Tax=Algoriphagus winogradskyi TaxID=237017 RepID=A0ABY1NN88_9BACT|nr:hypothetical protein SAMN06265367_102304 [Algoriphagus winogradskyi]